MPADVLIDTSIWIEAARRPDGAIGRAFKSLIADDRAVLAAPVWTELRVGAKTPRDLEKLHAYRAVLSWIEPVTRTWDQTGELGGRMRQAGVTVAMIDILIAQLAIDHKLTLFTLDTDFTHIAHHAPVTLYS